MKLGKRITNSRFFFKTAVRQLLTQKFLALSFGLFSVGVFAQTDSATSSVFESAYAHLPNDSLLGFIEIPAGTFTMGSNPLIDPMAFENERWSVGRRQGIVDLPTFYISRYEVTAAQYRSFIDDSNYRVEAKLAEIPDNHPVALVSWTDAIAYARWLENLLKLATWTPAIIRRHLEDGWHITLPTEAEWEKSARGTSGSIYPWGNQAGKEFSNYESDGTIPVGSLNCRQCAFGVQDMSGNVWEWTRSPYQDYPYDPSDNRLDLGEDALWVMRGGSFSDQANNVRVSVRGAADPGARREFIGFRLVLSPN